ncbi:MAG: formylglycine-generating enzyme family protein [Planctomycetes bacterium]|nr:formylglycine-generating enzyme family protein [Planctomycetota bacterium]
MRVRRRAAVVVVLLLLAGGIAAFLVPSRQSGRGAVPARDDDARRILRDVAAWDAATHDERRAAAAWVAARTQGVAFDGTETFGFNGHRHEIAVFMHTATGLEFSLVPGGTFAMGSSPDEAERFANEGPQQTVTIGGPFLLCRTETTQAAWERTMRSNPSLTRGADHPVDGVTWDESQRFCDGAGLRLPSEAEWEYACRAGTTTRFWSGDDDTDVRRTDWIRTDSTAWHRAAERVAAWLGRPSPSDHHPVAEKSANPFGLHDVHGNVWEWCQDASTGFLGPAPTDGRPRVDASAADCVVRGGGWNDVARGARSARRFGLPRSSRYGILGFRPAASVGQ